MSAIVQKDFWITVLPQATRYVSKTAINELRNCLIKNGNLSQSIANLQLIFIYYSIANFYRVTIH